MVADLGDAVARSAVVVDLSIPRLSMQQNMEPKVMCIPLSRSAYTDWWAGGWMTYLKEPNRIDSLGGYADLHCGWSRSDHDPSTCLTVPQTAPIDELLTRQVPGLCTPG